MLAKAFNVAEIDYVDNNKERLEIAQRLNANHIYEDYREVTGRYDLVIDANSTNSGLQMALKAVRNFGTISSSGIYIKKTSLSLIEMYAKGVHFKIGMANSRTDGAQILKLIDKVNIPFELATTKLDSWENAEDAFLCETTKVIVYREKIKKL